MKKAIFLILVATLMSLAGCKTSKESKSKIDSNIQTNFRVSKVIDSQKSLSLKVDSLFTQMSSFQKFINEVEQKKESESKQEIDYDTSKPIVPETGKPPVLKETNYNKNSESSKQLTSTEINNISTSIQKQIQSRVDSLYSSKIDSLASENKRIKSDLNNVFKTGRNAIESICIAFTALCLVLLSSLVVWRYRRKIISIFRKFVFKV